MPILIRPAQLQDVETQHLHVAEVGGKVVGFTHRVAMLALLP